ncbi:hypothetical protein POSPLADRAFT_1131548, partial [Postia placenta MAD-698-R-SB12]
LYAVVVGAHGQVRARKLGRASSRGPEAPIVVYNDRARCMYATRLSLTGIATPVDKRARRAVAPLFQQFLAWVFPWGDASSTQRLMLDSRLTALNDIST